jgi:hypothetical protein
MNLTPPLRLLTATLIIGASAAPLHADVEFLPREILVRSHSVINVTQPPFNAVPDDGKDDTAAIQAAIDSAKKRRITDSIKPWAYEAAHQVYLPAGVYDVSKPLVYTDNERDGYFTLIGDGPEKSIIRLKPKSPDFQDAAAPKAIMTYLDSNRVPSGGMSFQNYCRDLTFEVGAGNPGAVGVDFYNNNTGGVRNVTIRSLDPDGAGYAGLAISRLKAGVAYHTNIKIEGFDYGISGYVPGVTRDGNAHVFEDVELKNQRVAGVQVGPKRMAFIGLTSHNKVPAILINDREAGVNILNSSLLGGSPDQPAIDLRVGGLHAQDVKVEGYGMAVKNQGKDAGVDLSANVMIRTNRSGEPMPTAVTISGTDDAVEVDLPMNVAPPSMPWPDESDIYFISIKNQKKLDIGALEESQRVFTDAFASGKSTIVMIPGYYQFDKGVEIPPHVTRIFGWYSWIRQRPPLIDDPSSFTFKILPRTKPLIISHIWFSGGEAAGIVDASGADVILDGVQIHNGIGKVYESAGGGRLWLLNTVSRHNQVNYGKETLPSWTFGPGQQVFGRVFNPEQQDNRHVLVNGATLACLGGKVGEKFGPYFVVENSGKVRTIGQWINANSKSAIPPGRAVAAVDSSSQFSMAGMYYSEKEFVMPLALRQGDKGLPFSEVVAGEERSFFLPLVSTQGSGGGKQWVTPINVTQLPVDEPLTLADPKEAAAGKAAPSIGAISSESPKIRLDFEANQPEAWTVKSRTWKFETEGDTTFAQLRLGAVITQIPIPQCSKLLVTARMSLSEFTPEEKKYLQPGLEILFKDEAGNTVGSKFNFVKLDAETTGFVDVSKEFPVPAGTVSIQLMIRVTKNEADFRVDFIELECL